MFDKIAIGALYLKKIASNTFFKVKFGISKEVVDFINNNGILMTPYSSYNECILESASGMAYLLEHPEELQGDVYAVNHENRLHNNLSTILFHDANTVEMRKLEAVYDAGYINNHLVYVYIFKTHPGMVLFSPMWVEVEGLSIFQARYAVPYSRIMPMIDLADFLKG